MASPLSHFCCDCCGLLWDGSENVSSFITKRVTETPHIECMESEADAMCEAIESTFGGNVSIEPYTGRMTTVLFRELSVVTTAMHMRDRAFLKQVPLISLSRMFPTLMCLTRDREDWLTWMRDLWRAAPVTILENNLQTWLDMIDRIGDELLKFDVVSDYASKMIDAGYPHSAVLDFTEKHAPPSSRERIHQLLLQ